VADVAIRPGQLKALQDVRCQGCGKLLFRIDVDALKPQKVIEERCDRCDAMNYRIGRSTS